MKIVLIKYESLLKEKIKSSKTDCVFRNITTSRLFYDNT